MFLHPKTKEEHALARLERKTGPGYRGFTTEFSPDVTLEDDLRRRDLTINAMAQDDAGNVIDPLRRPAGPGGAPAAPCVRRLRRRPGAHPARGAFRGALRTARLPRRRRNAGADAAAWSRTAKPTRWSPNACGRKPKKRSGEPCPDVFVEVLRACGALKVVYPEIDALFGVPQPEKWHPEIDTGVHQLLACARR